MISIRFHGRGGQGTVNGAQILTGAIIEGGEFAQFIPAFGVERKGSPVFGFFRMDTHPILENNQVYNPNGVVILDDSLIDEINVFDGLQENAFVIVNTKRLPGELKVPDCVKKVVTLDATLIAREIINAEIPNTTLLGALAKAVDRIDNNLLANAIEKRFGEKNKEAFCAGYERAIIKE